MTGASHSHDPGVEGVLCTFGLAAAGESFAVAFAVDDVVLETLGLGAFFAAPSSSCCELFHPKRDL